MASTADPVTRATVPRQPEWTHPTTPASASTRTIGVQSAAIITSPTPASAVTRASVASKASSARRAPLPRSARVAQTTRRPWVW